MELLFKTTNILFLWEQCSLFENCAPRGTPIQHEYFGSIMTTDPTMACLVVEIATVLPSRTIQVKSHQLYHFGSQRQPISLILFVEQNQPNHLHFHTNWLMQTLQSWVHAVLIAKVSFCNLGVTAALSPAVKGHASHSTASEWECVLSALHFSRSVISFWIAIQLAWCPAVLGF